MTAQAVEVTREEQFLIQSEAEIQQWIEEHPHDKFTDDDILPMWGDFVRKWVAEYQGDFPYLTSLKDTFSRPNTWPSRGMIRGVLNCYRADYLRNKSRQQAVDFSSARPPAATVSKVEQVVADGRYTVVFGGEDDYVTLRIDQGKEGFIKRAKLPEGTQIASYLFGPDNSTNYKGFGFIFGNRFSPWSEFKGNARLADAVKFLLDATDEEQEAAGIAYSVRSNNCRRCGRALTVPISIGRGLGPVCWTHVYGTVLEGDWED